MRPDMPLSGHADESAAWSPCVRLPPYSDAVRIFQRRRRPARASKAAALATARKATAQLRRTNARARRYQARKQANPADRMTPNQWAGGGN